MNTGVVLRLDSTDGVTTVTWRLNNTGEVIKDEDGNRMRFKIGDDIKSLDENTGLSEDVAKILEILNQYDIKTPKQKGETSVTKAEVDNMIQKYLPKQN